MAAFAALAETAVDESGEGIAAARHPRPREAATPEDARAALCPSASMRGPARSWRAWTGETGAEGGSARPRATERAPVGGQRPAPGAGPFHTVARAMTRD